MQSATGYARPSVSVIIAAHNEAQNLPKLLSALQRQSYPKDLREFIVIDDRCNDGTPQLLNEWRHRLPMCCPRIDRVPDGINPKKFALAAGIRQARGEVIITTDADCIPPSTWVESLAGAFAKEVGAVVGVSPWHADEKLWSNIIAFESFATTIVSLAGIGHVRPFLAVGRNFAFRRELYQRVAGYSGDVRIFSGDDDLLLQKISRRSEYRVGAVFSPESQVPSRGAENLWAFIRQKRRHISAGRAYPRPQQIGYALYHFSNIFIWLCPLLLGFPGIALLLLKVGFDGLLFHQIIKRLQLATCRLSLAGFALLPWQLLFLLTHAIVGPLAFIGRIRWKS